MNPHRQKSTSKNWNGRLEEQKNDACLFGRKLQTATRVDADAKKSCQQALASVWLSLSQHLQNTLLDSRHGAARDSDGMMILSKNTIMVWWYYDYSAKM